MKSEYDFSDAVQGRFYTRPEDMEIPHYLTRDLEDRLRWVAGQQGKTPEDLLQDILEKNLPHLNQPH